MPEVGLSQRRSWGDMMQSEIDKRPYVHECGKTNYIFCPACVYAEGRKAAEMFRNYKILECKVGVLDGFDFYMSILAKAKNVEEAKGEE